MAPLTDDDLERFHENAPNALKRRDGGFFREQIGSSIELVVMGTIPIVGMVAFDWSAESPLLFMLAGAWMAIICDSLKYFLLRSAIERQLTEMGDDAHVWLVAEAIKDNKKEYPAHHGGGGGVTARSGLICDFLFGSISTALILYLVVGATKSNLATLFFRESGLVIALAIFVACQFLQTLALIVAHKADTASGRGIQFRAGLRGAGLFLLLWMVMFIHDSLGEGGATLRNVMLLANGGLVLIGVLNGYGMILLRQNARWLREYLKRRQEAND